MRKKIQSPKGYYSAEEAAIKLGVTTSNVYYLLKVGQIPEQIYKGKKFIKKTDLESRNQPTPVN